MNIQRISHWVYVAILSLAVLSTLATAIALSQFSQRKQALEELFIASNSIKDIRRGSGVLTTAARGFVSTRDPEYLNDYNHELKVERTRSKALETLEGLNLANDEIHLIRYATGLSDRLAALESDVLEKVQEADPGHYPALVFDEAYKQKKADLNQSLNAALEMVSARLSARAERLTWIAETTDFLGLALTLAIACAAVGALRGFFIPKVIGPMARLTRATDHLLCNTERIELWRGTDPDEIQALSRSLERYQDLIRTLRQQHRIEQAVAQLNLALSQCESQQAFAETLLKEVCVMTNPVSAAFYWRPDELQPFTCLLRHGSWTSDTAEPNPAALAEGCDQEGQFLMLPRPGTDLATPASGVSCALAIRNAGVTVALLWLDINPQDSRSHSYLRAITDLVSARHEVLTKTLRAAELLRQTRAQATVLDESRRKLMAQTSELGRLNSSLTYKTMRLEDMAGRLAERQGELATVKEWLQTVIESAPDGMVVAGANGHVILANNKFTDIFSCSREALAGVPLEDLAPREFQQVIATAFNEPSPPSGAVILLELDLALPDNESVRRHFLEITWSHLPQQTNVSDAVCINIRDVTIREQLKIEVAQAQREADRKRQLITAISDALPLAVFQVRGSRDTLQIEFVSEQIESLIGVSASRLMQDSSLRFLHSIVPGDDAQTLRLQQATRTILDGGPCVPHSRTSLVQHDGHTRSIRLHSVPCLTDDGHEVLWHGYCEDITEQDRDRQMLQNILDEAPSIVFVKDLDGRYLLTNRAFDRFFGLERGAAVHKDDFSILSSSDANSARGHDSIALSSPRPQQFVEDIRIGNKVHSFQSTKFPLLDHNGRAYAICGMANDVSEQKAEEAKVRTAMRMAEKASRIKTDFLANMSHEIRTPLNAVIGLSNLALRTPLDAQQKDYLRKIATAGNHLLGVINDVLDITKIEAGKLELEELEFSPRQVVERTLDLVCERAANKGLELICTISSNVPERVIGDSLRTRQVLTNFLSNAVKFTQTGEISVTVRAELAVDAVILEFSVTDSGIGISPDDIPRLFEVFEQGDGSTTRRFGGTGLGLAIAKRLAQAMKGEVYASSRPGLGSSFAFKAPFRRVATEVKPQARLALRSNARTLLVEPHPTTRDSILHLLAEIGLNDIETANNPSAALARLATAEQAGFAIGLVDIDSFGPQDQDFFERAKSGGLEPAPVWIAFTGGGARAAKLASIRLPGTRVLSKPLSRDRLLSELTSVLNGTPPTPSPDDLEQDDGALHAQLAGRLVLVVDDDPVNIQVAVELLQVAGCCVHQASSGAEALTLIKDNVYEAVLLDMQMPDMDGIETCRALRALPHGQGLYVIAMTANALAHDRERYLTAGLDEHLGKPITPQVLWKAVAQAIEHGKSATPPLIPSEDQGVPAIEGIDSSAALRCVAGNAAALQRILGLFATHHGDAIERARVALAANGSEPILRIAHTLRGACANIGAIELSAGWSKIEQAARENFDVGTLDRLLSAIEPSFARCLAGIRNAIGQTPSAVEAPPPTADLSALCKQLVDLAREGRGDVLDLLEAHQATLVQALPCEAPAVLAAAQRFDWDELIRRLQHIAATGADHG